ncbi:MAG: DUF2309 domain-containing protein, partial [Actinomycetota bacterium]|nr:DUF2309 domain-containing protein [Actinomycetota bacterium]
MCDVAHARFPAEVSPAERDKIVETIEHLGHLLPNQGPITTFVHHNTLHGLQHRHFDEALTAAESFFPGAQAYPSVEQSRRYYRAGRITDADLDAVLAERSDLARPEVVGTIGGTTITDAEIRRIHLISGVNPIDASTLRYLASECDATRRFMDDITEEARSLGRAKAVAELRDGIDRVGRDLMLSDWLGALVGLDVAAAVASRAREDLAHGSVSRRRVTALLQALGVPKSRHDGYLKLVDRALAGAGASESDGARRAWLSAEADVVERVARRHIGVPGNLHSLERAMLSDPDAFAVEALWTASLGAFAALDPFSATDPRTLGARDPDAAVDRLGELFVAIQTAGAPAIPLTPEERAEVEAAVRGALEQLRSTVASQPERASDENIREAAGAAWFALRELDDTSCSRMGFDALTTLASVTSDDRVAGVVSRIAAHDPLRTLYEDAHARVEEDLASFGREVTHADLVARLTGEDLTALVNGYMVRLCAAFLDHGQAAWRMPDRTLGFYRAWRSSVEYDPTLAVAGVRRWPPRSADLPEDPVAAVLHQLQRLGVASDDAGAYLGRLLATQPGWAGMMNWRGNNPGFSLQKTRPADLVEYLAVRLTVEAELVADALERKLGIDVADVTEVSERLRDRALEYHLRTELHRGVLPSIVCQVARDLERAEADGQQWANVAIQA